MITIKADTQKYQQLLGQLSSVEIKSAIAIGITKTAQKVKEGGVALIREKFPTATRYTLNGIFVNSATPRTLTAQVGFIGRNGGTHHYLDAEVTGGIRRDKGFEKKMDNQFAMPGRGLALDAEGNIPRNQLGKMLLAYAAAMAGGDVSSGPSTSTDAYVVIRKQTGNLRPGIYKRTATGEQKLRHLLAAGIIKQGKYKGMLKELKSKEKATYQRGLQLVLLLGVKAPQYKPTFDFNGMATRVAARNLGPDIETALRIAIENSSR